MYKYEKKPKMKSKDFGHRHKYFVIRHTHLQSHHYFNNNKKNKNFSFYHFLLMNVYLNEKDL